MKVLLISVVLLQAWCNALPNPNGVASYTYQDSTGKRYGGTYGLRDNISPFSEPVITPYRAAYIPEFFNNFGGILQHENLARVKRRLFFGRPRFFRNREFGFDKNRQRLALRASDQTFDLYNSGGYNPTFFRFPFGGFPFGGFGAFNMGRLAHNSAFSSAAAGPGFTRQSAIISPANPNNPNVVVNRYEEPQGPGDFYSVSSSSYSSSNDNNGKLSGFRGSETIVNNNGKVTKYRVTS